MIGKASGSTAERWSTPTSSLSSGAAIFDRCWLYVGHDSELPEPHDFRARTRRRPPADLQPQR